MAVVEEQIVIVDEWRGLYSESWKGVIVDEAFAHPAKFSRALIRKIYDHVIAEGWAIKGDSVVDPFGGVALGGFDAMRHGLNFVGVELEQKFVGLGNQNIALWNERFSRMPNWGTARLLQGDSRKLAEVLNASDCCISSPPYAGGCAHKGGDDPKPENLKGGDYHGVGLHLGVSSPPYAGYDDHGGRATAAERDRRRLERLRPDLSGRFDTCFKGSEEYGQTEGQLGAMKEGDHSQTLAISSPPHIHPPGKGGHSERFDSMADQKGLPRPEYGNTPGQISEMQPGDHSIAITSPPYHGNEKHDSTWQERSERAGKTQGRGSFHSSAADYGTTEGQLGAMPEGQLCVTSPPYNPPMSQDHNGTRGGQRGTTPSEKGAFVKYRNSEGQLEGMSMDGFNAAVTSPPYSESLTYQQPGAGGEGNELMRQGFTVKEIAEMRKAGDPRVLETRRAVGYSREANNLGNQRGETFWSASRLILEQLHQVLTPHAHAVFVTKRFVRNKQIVDFTDQWIQLCEAVGFRLFHHHKAMLVEDYGVQGGFETDKAITIARKSFFRRLAESKNSPAIDWEDVTCFIKL